MILDSPIITGSLQVSGSISSTGPFNGSITSAVTASYLNGNVTASGHLVPDTHEAYDLGSSTLRWRDLYLSGSTINLGGTEISTDADGHVEFHIGSTRKKLIVDELIIGSDSSTQRRLSINDGNLRIQTDGGTEASVDSAATASIATTAQTASYVAGANVDGIVTSASYAISASHEIVFETSASHAQNADDAISSSYAISASYAPVEGFPYTGSADVTGSLNVTGSVSFPRFDSTAGNTNWSSGGAMITARRVIVGGGTQNAAIMAAGTIGSNLQCTETYDGSSFSAGPATINSLDYSGGGSSTSFILAGGYSGGTGVGTTEEYDGSSWSSGGTLINGRHQLTRGLNSGTTNSFVIGGGSGIGGSNTIVTCTEEYDGTSWSDGGAMIVASRNRSSAGSQNATLAFGAQNPARTCTEAYDGTSWSTGGALSSARYHAGEGGTQNAASVFGGLSPSVIGSKELYDGTSWSSGASLITSRWGIGGAGSQNSELAAGGGTPSNVTCTEEAGYEGAYIPGFVYDKDTGTTTSTSFVESSALRYKEDVKPLNSQLDKVMQLKPVSYTWSPTQDQHIGLVAEEVNKLYPEFVGHNNKGEIEGIQYSKMVSVLIQSIQEQQQQINELKTQLSKK